MAQMHSFIYRVVKNPYFDGCIIFTILLNAVVMAMETDYEFKYRNFVFFFIVDEIFMGLYTMEFLMKFYAEPLLYWKNGYNVFDFVVLALSQISTFLDGYGNDALESVRIFQACRVLRVLKFVSFVPGLQAIIEAMFQTIKKVSYVIMLMILVMFLFAVYGHDTFGNPVTGDVKSWGDLESSLLTIFSLATVDGWTELQDRLDLLGFQAARIFSVIVVIIGFFIFFSMFIAIIIFEIQNSLQKFEVEKKKNKQEKRNFKLQSVLRRHKKETRLPVKTQTGDDEEFSEKLSDFRTSISGGDFLVMEDLCTSLAFIDMYLTSLDYQDQTLNTMQQHYKEVLYTLSTMQERGLLQQAQSIEQTPERNQQMEQTGRFVI